MDETEYYKNLNKAIKQMPIIMKQVNKAIKNMIKEIPEIIEKNRRKHKNYG